jgi:cellulose biosynthesis protein BcsQ
LTEASGDYDGVLIDTRAGFARSTLAALRGSTHALVVVPADPLGLRTLPQTLKLFAWLRDKGHNVQLAGLLLTMVDLRAKWSEAAAREVWERYPQGVALEAFLPRDPVFLEAAAAGLPVQRLGRVSPAVSQALDRVVAELWGRLERGEGQGGGDGTRSLVD